MPRPGARPGISRDVAVVALAVPPLRMPQGHAYPLPNR